MYQKSSFPFASAGSFAGSGLLLMLNRTLAALVLFFAALALVTVARELAALFFTKTHREPECHGTEGCTYAEPHRHGFDCDKSCAECHGYCHPSCPAFPDIALREENEEEEKNV